MVIKATIEIGINVPEGTQVFNALSTEGCCLLLPSGERLGPWAQFELVRADGGDPIDMGDMDFAECGVSFDYIDRFFSRLDGVK